MYTLALDETSGFEEFTGDDGKAQVTFIGGIIFDDKDDCKEKDAEKERIKQYYEKVVTTANTKGKKARFPEDIHSSNTTSNKVIRAVKAKMEDTLLEFLKDGTYDGEILGSSRKGNYHIICYIKSETGKTVSGNSILVKDNFASNLYLNMLRNTLQRFVYENILIEPETHFDLKIATRATGSYDKTAKLGKDYETLGYYQNSSTNQEGKIWNRITNEDVIRTMNQDLQYRENAGIQVDSCSAESITYKKERVDACIFLYLADSVCSILSHKINLYNNGKEKKSNLNHRIMKICNELYDAFQPQNENTPSDCQFWMFLYDDIDEQYGELLDLYKKKKYYEALKLIYCIRQKKDEFSEWYNKQWLCHVEKRISQEMTTETFKDTVYKLYKAQSTNTYNNVEGLYIFQFLEKISEYNKQLQKDRNNMKQLNVAGVIAYCHFAESNKAEQYYNKCINSYIDNLGDDVYRLDNMLCDSYLDSFMWQKAIKFMSRIEKMNKKRLQERKNYGKNIGIGYLDDAKVKSQAGQIYAFLRSTKSEEYFISAMDVLSLQNEKTADYYITMSYLMHYYIDNRNQDKYDALAEEYFSSKNPQEQLQYILDERKKEQPIIHFNYALYLYLKGLYSFHHNEINDVIWIQIKDIKEILDTIAHPMELIAKYIAWIAIERGDVDTLEICKAKLTYDKTRNYTTVEAIRHMSMIQVLKKEAELTTDSNIKMKREIEVEKAIKEMAKLLTENISGFYTIDETNVKQPKLDLAMDPKELYDILKNYFVYMYN